MAKKVLVDNRPFCDECKFAEWHTQEWNRDADGRPITFGCKKKVFDFGEVRGRKACANWQKRAMP